MPTSTVLLLVEGMTISASPCLATNPCANLGFGIAPFSSAVPKSANWALDVPKCRGERIATSEGESARVDSSLYAGTRKCDG
jgi:hypothetical protein